MHEESITGVVERIIFKNEDNGYHVLSVLLNSTGKEHTVTLNQIKVHEGTTCRFEGQWQTNAKFGNQFKASRAIEIIPETKEAMVRYLSSSFFKGIGPVMAKKIVDKFGDNVMDVLKNDINKLLKIQGVSQKKLETIKKSWEENSEINNIMVFLNQYNISTLFASKIYEYYGKDCIEKMKENPYKLADDISGVGFRKADDIAMDMGFLKDSDVRIAAGIKYVLNENETEGHCYLTYSQIVENTVRLLETNIQERIENIINTLVFNNEIKLTIQFGDKRYYSNQTYYNERCVADKINTLNKMSVNKDEKIIQEWINDFVNEKIKLSNEQIQGIIKAVNSGVSILTGAAGTGKTTSLLFLIKLLEKLKIDFLIASPTGKSAMRITEVTGYAASTIHRMLGYNPQTGFNYNERNPLHTQFIILDESSMIDINLFSHVMRAMKDDTQLLLCGDHQQLPPVSCGNPFKDLIASNKVFVNKLTQIYRQDEASDIIKFAHNIIKGEIPQIKSPLDEPGVWIEGDCMFIDSGEFDQYKSPNDYPKWMSQAYGFDTMGMLKKIYFETIPKYFGENEKIQLISPMNKSNYGTTNINQIFRDIINPQEDNKPQIDLKKLILRKGDVVIQVKNNYEIGVMNGEIGTIVEMNPAEKTAFVQFEGRELVEYKRNDLLDLKLGYCVSCHKMQGSECSIVLAVLTNEHRNLLFRSLLYTLITRARKKFIFVGDRRSLEYAVKNIREDKRQTSLQELLNINETF